MFHHLGEWTIVALIIYMGKLKDLNQLFNITQSIHGQKSDLTLLVGHWREVRFDEVLGSHGGQSLISLLKEVTNWRKYTVY